MPKIPNPCIPNRDPDITMDYRVGVSNVKKSAERVGYEEFSRKACKWQMGLGLDSYAVSNEKKPPLHDTRVMQIWCKH